MERAEMTTMTSKKTRSKAEPTPAATRRKKAEFTIPIKLWVSAETYDELEAEAREREWTVPQVIRRRIRELAHQK